MVATARNENAAGSTKTAPSSRSPNAARSLSLVPTTTHDVAGRRVHSADNRPNIVNAIVSAVSSTPLSRRISMTKLRAVLEHSFVRFVDGARFDFDPILQNVIRDRGAKVWECRVAIAAVAERLAPFGLKVEQKTIRTKRIGELLLSERRLSQADLDRALRAQASVGGRLGRHLVKLGCVSEGALAHYLSQQLEVPCAEVALLKRIRPEIAELLPADLARAHFAVPIGVSGGALKVAMADPSDRAAIEAISARTNRHILPIVAPESAIEAALELAYGTSKQIRPRQVSVSAGSGGDEEFQVVHTSQRRGEAKKHVQTATPSGPQISVEDRGDFFKAEREDLVHDETSRADLLASLTRATSVAEVTRVAMKLLATAAPRVAAFLVYDARLTGMAHVGCDIADDDLRNMTIQLADSAIFAAACGRKQVAAGVAATSNVDDALLASLGVPEGSSLARLPLVDPDRGNTVAVLVAAGEDQAILSERAFFAQIAEKASLALVMVALKRAILDQP